MTDSQSSTAVPARQLQSLFWKLATAAAAAGVIGLGNSYIDLRDDALIHDKEVEHMEARITVLEQTVKVDHETITQMQNLRQVLNTALDNINEIETELRERQLDVVLDRFSRFGNDLSAIRNRVNQIERSMAPSSGYTYPSPYDYGPPSNTQ